MSTVHTHLSDIVASPCGKQAEVRHCFTDSSLPGFQAEIAEFVWLLWCFFCLSKMARTV